MIDIARSKAEVRGAVSAARRDGKRIGFVPTMGALHEGHISLVRAACARTDFVIVSIFVNPTQFGPGEDFERYPRDLDADVALLAAEGVELVFAPSTDTMYATDAQIEVDPGPLAERWEGQIRPGHFRGVATVVTKLLNVVGADLAFFGDKDYQQLSIVRRLAEDLDLATGIVGCPIVRDADGLALSSRNAYLTAEQRSAALGLPAALEAAAQALAWGERSGDALAATMRSVALDGRENAVELDYAAVVDPESLEPLETVDRPARAIIAGRVGATRLIDNCSLVPPAETC